MSLVLRKLAYNAKTKMQISFAVTSVVPMIDYNRKSFIYLQVGMIGWNFGNQL